MKFNSNFSVKDLFRNRELSSIFPQFTKKDTLKDMRDGNWIENKMLYFLKNLLGGRIRSGEIIVNGNYREKYNEIVALVPIVQQIFNRFPDIWIRSFSSKYKFLTPFISIEQIKESSPIYVLGVIAENLKYNPKFINIFEKKSHGFLREQREWFKKVGLR